MFNKKFRLCFSIIAVMALVFVNIPNIQAGQGSGSYTYRVANSRGYYDRATAYTDTSAGWGNTDIYTSGYANVPAGHMGAASQLFRADGALCKSSAMLYNSSSSSTLSVSTDRQTGSVGYYSVGIATYYNGSGYDNYLTKASPTVYLSSPYFAALQVPESLLQENENDQTYGSAYVAQVTGNMPELVSAVATDGTLGYVYSQDLQFATPSNPEEALALNAQAATNPTIPVYAVDGTTIVGTFQFTTEIVSK